MNENKLMGFTVYRADDGEPIIDGNYAMTQTGELIMLAYRRSGYVSVPKEGKFIVQYGGGKLERW